MGRKQESVPTRLWNKLFCLWLWLQRALCDDISHFTLCVWLVYEKGNIFLLYHDVIPFVSLSGSSPQPTLTLGCQDMTLLCLLTMFHAYLCSSTRPTTFLFLLNIHMWDCNVFVLCFVLFVFFPFFEKMAKSRKENVMTDDVFVLSDTEGNNIFLLIS